MPSRKRSSTSRPVPAASRTPGDDKTGEDASPADESDVPQGGECGRAERPDALLRAGLTALDNVRHDVVRHHTDMIERLLGIQRPSSSPSARLMPTLGLGGLESFGLRKFEDVLDQRVAAALQRLGYPDADELQGMRDEIAQLRAEVLRLRRQAPGRTASEKSSSSARTRIPARKRPSSSE